MTNEVVDQNFEAYLAHVVGCAQTWTTGPHPINLIKAIGELRAYYYSRYSVEPRDDSRELLAEIAAEWFGEYCGPESVQVIYDRIVKCLGRDPFAEQYAVNRTPSQLG